MQSVRNYGLTLIEVLIAVGIATVAGVLLLVIIVNSVGLFSKQSSKVQEGLNMNDALSEIRSSIKQATGIADTSSANQLVLRVSSIDTSGNIIDNTFDYFVFSLDQHFLKFKILPDSLSSRKAQDRVFSSSVDNINFQYFNSATPPVEVIPPSATKVRTTLVLKQQFGADSETSTATSEASLRND
ncbi:hypothetical protein HYU94_03060 [Candidatus Daviesbacteria bacterium]|nr:hypothetical protein [Candidatus Daviesbacteria bacterium]